MHVSGSGPLGVLLMIAPLAAIPVFAILGVPHFAPVSASGTDDDDFVELGETSSRPPAPAVPLPAATRSADDLYAPAADSPPRPLRANASADQERRPSLPTAAAGRSRGSGRRLPPSEALDQWEVRTDVRDTVSPSRKNEPADSSSSTIAEGFEGLEDSADDVDQGHVSAEGFNPDLLKADRANPSKKGTRPEVDVPLELPPDRGPSSQSSRGAGSGRATAFAADVVKDAVAQARTPDEQAGWQDAARRLKKLGIRKYRLESRIDEQNFVFMCTFASPDNPRVVRRFEADADNPLEAVQQVLVQIDEWRSREGVAGQTALLPDDEN
jgi:hypothetical protein